MAGEPMAGEPELGGDEIVNQLFNAQSLSGSWTRCQSETARSLRFNYRFTATEELQGTWRYEEDRFGEEQCIGSPSMTLIKEGTFILGDGLDLIDQARSITLNHQAILLRANNANTAQLLGTLCPEESFIANVPTDLSETGCERLSIKALSECPERFDLVSLTHESLYFGVMENGESEACVEQDRPTRLGEPLNRAP